MEQLYKKTVINPIFIFALGLTYGRFIFTTNGIFTKSLIIAVIGIGIAVVFTHIGKKIVKNIPLRNIRIIESVVILTAPMVFFIPWIIIVFLIMISLVSGSDDSWNNDPSKLNLNFKESSIKSFIPIMIYSVFFGAFSASNGRLADYGILIWILYYLWSILYICKLQTIQIKISE